MMAEMVLNINLLTLSPDLSYDKVVFKLFSRKKNKHGGKEGLYMVETESVGAKEAWT